MPLPTRLRRALLWSAAWAWLGLAASLPAQAAETFTYTIAPGDTLEGLAQRFGTTVEILATLNNLRDPNWIIAGDTLLIPASGSPPAPDDRFRPTSRGRPALTYIWPALGPITTYFSRAHPGLDIGTAYGAPVRAALPGLVIEAATGWNSGYGTYVKLSHPNGHVTLYAHLGRLAVAVGDWIDQGDLLGTVGMTGRTTGPHLHFEVRIDGVRVDPLRFLP